MFKRIKNFKKRLEEIEYYQWYWYKGFPFVVAETKNKEWEVLEKMIDNTPALHQMYNTNGGWYILESPLYWFLEINIKDFCFYDSLHFQHTKMNDKERWIDMINKAKRDIDSFWSFKNN